MKRHIVSSEDVIGVDVMNPKGESLGTIEALMLNKVEGTVAYVVLSFGGFLGMGDKLFAMPWSAFSYNEKEDCFILSIDKEKLKNSPGFDKNHWPDMSNPTWVSTINNYYQNLHTGPTH